MKEDNENMFRIVILLSTTTIILLGCASYNLDVKTFLKDTDGLDSSCLFTVETRRTYLATYQASLIGEFRMVNPRTLDTQIVKGNPYMKLMIYTNSGMRYSFSADRFVNSHGSIVGPTGLRGRRMIKVALTDIKRIKLIDFNDVIVPEHYTLAIPPTNCGRLRIRKNAANKPVP